jgi:hypothetical protein
VQWRWCGSCVPCGVDAAVALIQCGSYVHCRVELVRQWSGVGAAVELSGVGAAVEWSGVGAEVELVRWSQCSSGVSAAVMWS